MLSTTKPIILTFQVPLLNKYYYYRTISNGTTVYFGKTFSYNDNGSTVVKLDLRRILQANAYNSQYSLKPVYDATRQIYTPSFSTTKRFADTDIMQEYVVQIESDLEGTVVATQNVIVTSAYDLISEMPAPSRITGFINPLSYRTNLVPHYPNAVTDKYGIYFFTEHSSGNSTTWLYLLDTPLWNTRNYQLTSSSNLDTSSHIGYRNTLPFNVTMRTFFTDIVNAFNGTTIEDNIVIGGNYENVSDIILGGNSTDIPDIIIAGDSTNQSGQEIKPLSFSGDLYIARDNSIARNNKVAHVDECNKKYYLAWVTHSGAPFSYGFDGNTVKKSSVERTVITSYTGFDTVAAIEQHLEWELRSGVVDKETYDIFADILDSPYLYLYSVEEDKAWYCTLQDNDFTWKKVKTERQPLNLTLNLKECSTINK